MDHVMLYADQENEFQSGRLKETLFKSSFPKTRQKLYGHNVLASF